MAKGSMFGVARRKRGWTRPRRPTPRRSVEGSVPWNPIRSQWEPYLRKKHKELFFGVQGWAKKNSPQAAIIIQGMGKLRQK